MDVTTHLQWVSHLSHALSIGWRLASFTRTVTGVSIRCTLLSSARISRAFKHSCFTSNSEIISQRRSCSICLNTFQAWKPHETCTATARSRAHCPSPVQVALPRHLQLTLDSLQLQMMRPPSPPCHVTKLLHHGVNQTLAHQSRRQGAAGGAEGHQQHCRQSGASAPEGSFGATCQIVAHLQVINAVCVYSWSEHVCSVAQWQLHNHVVELRDREHGVVCVGTGAGSQPQPMEHLRMLAAMVLHGAEVLADRLTARPTL